MSCPEKQAASTEFLVAEFGALQDQVVRLEQAKSNRVNFFLIVVAAVVAGVSGLVTNPGLQHSLNLVLIVASTALLLLGIATLNELVHYSESIVSLYRRAGRIRRWFVDFDPEIAPYLAFEATDGRPKVDLATGYLTFRGGDAVILALNSVAFCVLAVATICVIYPVSVAVALLTAVVAAFLFGSCNRIVCMPSCGRLRPEWKAASAFHTIGLLNELDRQGEPNAGLAGADPPRWGSKLGGDGFGLVDRFDRET